MAITLQVRTKGTSTVLFDFTDATGAANPSGLKSRLMGFDGGGNTKVTEWFSPSNRDGDLLVHSRHGRRVLGLSLLLEGSNKDFDTLRAGVEGLISVLEDGTAKEIYWQGQTTVRYLDFQTADISRVLTGDHQGSVMAFDRGKIIGHPVSIYVGPWERSAPVTFINALTFGVDPVASVQGRTFTGTGNTKAPLNLTISPVQAGSKVSEVLVASRTRADVADLVATTGMAKLDASANNWTVTLSNDTTPVDDTANGGVGSGARLLGTSGNVGVMLRRVRVTRTTFLNSLRGWERVRVRVRMSGVGAWKLKLGWAPSLADPVTNFNEPVTHEVAAGTTSFGYVEKDLGYIRVPEEGALGGVVLEIHAQRISGTGDLHMNFVRNLPATPDKDMLTRIVALGGASESWLFSELVTPTNPAGLVAGTLQANNLALTAVSSAGGTPPNTGLAWPAGRHRVSFDVELWSDGATLDYTYRVRNVTDSTNATTQSIIDAPLGIVRRILQLEFDSVAGKSYQPQVIRDGGSGESYVFVYGFAHEFIPYLQQNEQAHTEPDNGIIHKRDSSGNILSRLGHEGSVPLDAPPGLTAIFVIPLDVPKAGYSEPESVKARTVTVTAAGSPRTLS